MNAFVIWIDREHAKIFPVSEERLEKKTLLAKQSEHHTHKLDNLDHQRQENWLFEESVAYMRNAEKILVLGPGVAKHHFITYLMEQHPALARKVTDCETVDHPSDAQIIAYAKKYFQIGVLAATK